MNAALPPSECGVTFADPTAPCGRASLRSGTTTLRLGPMRASARAGIRLAYGDVATNLRQFGIPMKLASTFALPVSMTHVGVGSLAGMGWSTGQARWDTLRTIVLSWLLTLPLAAALGALTFVLMERITL